MTSIDLNFMINILLNNIISDFLDMIHFFNFFHFSYCTQMFENSYLKLLNLLQNYESLFMNYYLYFIFQYISFEIRSEFFKSSIFLYLLQKPHYNLNLYKNNILNPLLFVILFSH